MFTKKKFNSNSNLFCDEVTVHKVHYHRLHAIIHRQFLSFSTKMCRHEFVFSVLSTLPTLLQIVYGFRAAVWWILFPRLGQTEHALDMWQCKICEF